MRNAKIFLFVVVATGGLVVFAFFYQTADAYSMRMSGEDLFLPFQNFIRSMSSVGMTTIRIGQPFASAPGKNRLFTTTAQDAFRQFDNWLYGIAGFHISGFFTAILNIFSWLLGVIRGAVDWLRLIL